MMRTAAATPHPPNYLLTSLVEEVHRISLDQSISVSLLAVTLSGAATGGVGEPGFRGQTTGAVREPPPARPRRLIPQAGGGYVGYRQFPKRPFWGPAPTRPRPAFLPRPQRCPLNYLPLALLMAFPKLPSAARYPLLTGLSPRQDWFGLTSMPHPAPCPLPSAKKNGCDP